MSIEDNNKTYAQRLISFKMIDLKTRNEITNAQKRAKFKQINQTLYTFYYGTKYQKRKVMSSTNT